LTNKNSTHTDPGFLLGELYNKMHIAEAFSLRSSAVGSRVDTSMMLTNTFGSRTLQGVPAWKQSSLWLGPEVKIDNPDPREI